MWLVDCWLLDLAGEYIVLLLSLIVGEYVGWRWGVREQIAGIILRLLEDIVVRCVLSKVVGCLARTRISEDVDWLLLRGIVGEQVVGVVGRGVDEQVGGR